MNSPQDPNFSNNNSEQNIEITEPEIQKSVVENESVDYIDESVVDLPEGVRYFKPVTSQESVRAPPSTTSVRAPPSTTSVRAPPSTTSVRAPPSTTSILKRSESRCSTASIRSCRWDALARPKSHFLQGTLEQFENVLKDKHKETLKKQLHDQKVLREATECEHLRCCTRPPTPHPPSGRRPPIDAGKREQTMDKFNAQLKRDAFDRLMDKIFNKLPHLVLEADITNLSRLPATTQLMVNVIFSSLTNFAGKPITIHDHELYLHMCVGLARFIESMIESVRRKVFSSESLASERQQHGCCSLTTAILEHLKEQLSDIQCSREILKPI
ncbi:uncharacterized protein LOC134227473 [Armigeres subalbatus]|uniref:uncharacterized protein LOC134227473 n=1 Tax=Armigeres subalbatus TaxID=124917 RepID=UPI002ED0411E